MKALRYFLSFLSSQYMNLGSALFVCALFAVALNSCGSGGNEPETTESRTIDGSGNNLRYPQMNQAGAQLFRLARPAYADKTSSFAGPDRPNPRKISNTVHAQGETSIPNQTSTTNFMWLWGQFMDHDITFSDDNENDPADIKIPKGDKIFDPDGTGAAVIFFARSIHDPDTGTSTDNPRQQLNGVTGWIDASTVYGSDERRANALRTNDGTGKLMTSEGNLLPYNRQQFPNSRFQFQTFFLAGDERVNENLGILSIQTLFMREHNRLAEEIAMSDPGLSGEEIYQRARRIVGAHMQAITYNEFLPLLLGPDALPPYSHYDDSTHAGVANSFSSAAFRMGHTFLDPEIPLIDAQGNETEAVALKDAFFKPEKVARDGIDPILRGFATRRHQRVDELIIDDVRNFLFIDDFPTGRPGIRGLDLVSLNIHRGRDHGLPSYNDMREALELERKESFSQINKDPEVQRKLREAYGTNQDGTDNTDDMDVWSAGISEDPHGKSMLGELFHTIISHQFRVLRDGDRFWYQRILSPEELREVEETKLADIIRRNTEIGDEIGDNVFMIE